VLGAYTLDDVLGEGGMGIVYLATHTRLGRRVAIKVLRSEYQDHPQAIRRFFAEARAVNKIAHPNIVEVTDFVERPGEDNYYVMELLEGTSLAVLIDTGGVPRLERSIDIMTQLAEALAAVHRAGIVHRDVKPDNVVLIEKSGKSDFVKLCDFGVAKLTDSGLDRIAMHSTSQGAVLGTPEYMSPEQASGKPVDPRSDVYSFGVMLYEIATGRVPFSAPDFGEMVVQLLRSSPIPPSQLPNLTQQIPPALEALTLQCLAKDPAQRPKDMEIVGKRLEQIAEQEGWLVYELNVRAPTATRMSGQVAAVSEPPRRPPSGPAPALIPAADPTTKVAIPARNRRTLVVAAAIAAVLVIGIVAVVAMRGDDKAPPTTEIASKIDAELAIADERTTAGRLVAPGGDAALDHLLAAKALDPKHAEPDNKAAAKKMHDIEQQMLEKQREAATPDPVPPKKKKR
jgi:serine/threonine-protein kinase